MMNNISQNNNKCSGDHGRVQLPASSPSGECVGYRGVGDLCASGQALEQTRLPMRNTVVTDPAATVAEIEKPQFARHAHSLANMACLVDEEEYAAAHSTSSNRIYSETDLHYNTAEQLADDEESIQDASREDVLIQFSDVDVEPEQDDRRSHFEVDNGGTLFALNNTPARGAASNSGMAPHELKACLLGSDLKSNKYDGSRPERRARAMSEQRDDPVKGVAYYVLHTVLMSANLYVNKAAFALNPLVGVMQFTFLRGVIATALMLVWGRGNLKHALWDSVDRSNVFSLTFRCLQGGISVLISYMCIKFFNVSTVGIVCSLTPLFVCFMAYFLLGERLKPSDWAALLAVFVAVLLVILGAEGEESSTMSANPLAVVALIMQPILLAAGAVAMRQMRKLPETTCSTYQNLALTILSAGFMVGYGLDFNFMFEFGVQAWLLAIASALLTIFTQTAKFTAFKYQQASQLQKLAFVPNVWQFSVDLFILGLAFSGLQYLGFAILFSFYSFEIARYLYSRHQLRKQKAAANTEDRFMRV